MLLNAGYGLIEIVGGFIAASQSVKADALDFIGEGVISFLGLIAVGCGLAARAKAALLQGIFLGFLGAGVLVATAYRLLVQHQPEAQLMGTLALIGLAVNGMAAVVLLPHRRGDANVRAVWLFSRNDAIGNDRGTAGGLDADAVAGPDRSDHHRGSLPAIGVFHHQGCPQRLERSRSRAARA